MIYFIGIIVKSENNTQCHYCLAIVASGVPEAQGFIHGLYTVYTRLLRGFIMLLVVPEEIASKLNITLTRKP